MSLIKEFHGRVDTFNRAKNRLVWEKTRLQPRRVVLAGEFYEAAIKPLLGHEHSFFADYFSSKHSDAKDLVKNWIVGDAIVTFPVSAEMTGMECPAYTYRNVFDEQEAPIRHMAQRMDMMSNGQQRYERQALHNHRFRLGKKDEYPAVRLGDLLYSFELEYEQAKKISPREWAGLLSPASQTVVDFWHLVNSLKDYSQHFMDIYNLSDDDRWGGKKKPPRPKRRVASASEFGWGGLIGAPT